ncbi:hypothetical protein QQS21_005455 [Conoideocrella luteorostrata]|uniref:Acyltransferase 3 domain-containing protein n=1 Tax=Conoideocrella luteorostrata TaxID=1105319 RepID=A0AAJ0CSI8_9HYPO|nr:hypothetical protein QQS21_005455 [Conoideocrella luteorostrata]
MLSGVGREPALECDREQQLSLLPQYEDHTNSHNHNHDHDHDHDYDHDHDHDLNHDHNGLDENASKSASGSRPRGNRVECLDGLRGIACIAVFNYHFLWPWTQSIMLSYGMMGPRSPEPYMNWLSLPIICLLHRGRPMVAVFFAISGYVLCRHIIRSIHERDWETFRRNLSSAVFRRVFRLYIPPTLSMLIVALLAQTGTFRSETAIYKGPDSIFINGSVTTAQMTKSCFAGSFPAVGAPGIADYMGLRSSGYLDGAAVFSDMVCLHRKSQLLPPTALEVEVKGFSRLQWVQYGGSWEEHPLMHGNLTHALQDFGRVYAEWANPFNANNYYPRYDPHTWTIPVEFRGSMLIYIFLLGTLALKPKWRLSLAGCLSVYSLAFGRWDMATFLGGAMLSDLDIWTSLAEKSQHRASISPATDASFSFSRICESAVARWAAFTTALYLLSYPDIGAEYTPGFVFLSWFVPRYYLPFGGWMFYQPIGALLLLPCVIRSPLLSNFLEGPVAQYLGKISFSLYLIHGPILHSLGFWVMPRLFEHFGRTGGYVIGWVGLFSISLYLAHWWYKNIDIWSTGVGKRLERLLAN